MIITTTNFRETAKAWAQENPTAIVNGTKQACNLTWRSVHSEYKVNGQPILKVLQFWSNEKQGFETGVIMVTENNWREFIHTWTALFPSTVVNGAKEASDLTWISVHSEYKVNGKPIIEVLQEWVLSNTVLQVQTPVVETEQAPAVVKNPRVYDSSLMGDYFTATAKAWAQENPSVYVVVEYEDSTPRLSEEWAYNTSPDKYIVSGAPLLDLLQDWIEAKAVKAEVQLAEPAFPPVTSLDLAIEQVKKAGFMVCSDDPNAKYDFAIQIIEEQNGDLDGLVEAMNRQGFWICNESNELETAMKDHLQNDGWIVYRDADANEEDTIDCLRLKGWTITPPKSKQWIVNAEVVIKFTETIEANTEEEAHEIMRQKYENGDLDNGLGNDAQFGLTGTSPV